MRSEKGTASTFNPNPAKNTRNNVYSKKKKWYLGCGPVVNARRLFMCTGKIHYTGCPH